MFVRSVTLILRKSENVNRVFIAIDCNETGKRIERLILSEELNNLKHFSEELTVAIVETASYITAYDGEVYLAGGDNILARVSEAAVSSIYQYFSTKVGPEVTFECGLGDSPVDAYLALKYAKAMHAGKPVRRGGEGTFDEITL